MLCLRNSRTRSASQQFDRPVRPTAAKQTRRGRPRHRGSARLGIDARRLRVLRERLLQWASESGRHFSWREADPEPFTILVTEILLAKTRAELVSPIAEKLLTRYPRPRDLAVARRRDLESLLYPLGLYRKRAEHLVRCARALVDDFAGAVPSTVADLMTLPYVGRYAANAIASVAFNAEVPIIDANVSRVYQRVFSLPPPPDRLASAHDLWALAERVLPVGQAKEFNWAVLDLGALVCTPRRPSCERCPIATTCDTGSRPGSIMT